MTCSGLPLLDFFIHLLLPHRGTRLQSQPYDALVIMQKISKRITPVLYLSDLKNTKKTEREQIIQS